ncbi:DUF488 family protein, N3 subclade [Hymenobacter frigidus]|uniref:DUF488 family protein, N3 subclade n=1 Tax=Hymenobacter frigidus TaxID=1524095 RepID=UPI00166DE03B|nr:DUF488 family protein [Hymenobacter frigidus]
MVINIKRVYEKPTREDGTRILVDRLWPRGLTKEKAGENRLHPGGTQLNQTLAPDPERHDGR